MPHDGGSHHGIVGAPASRPPGEWAEAGVAVADPSRARHSRAWRGRRRAPDGDVIARREGTTGDCEGLLADAGGAYRGHDEQLFSQSRARVHSRPHPLRRDLPSASGCASCCGARRALRGAGLRDRRAAARESSSQTAHRRVGGAPGRRARLRAGADRRRVPSDRAHERWLRRSFSARSLARRWRELARLVRTRPLALALRPRPHRAQVAGVSSVEPPAHERGSRRARSCLSRACRSEGAVRPALPAGRSLRRSVLESSRAAIGPRRERFVEGSRCGSGSPARAEPSCGDLPPARPRRCERSRPGADAEAGSSPTPTGRSGSADPDPHARPRRD